MQQSRKIREGKVNRFQITYSVTPLWVAAGNLDGDKDISWSSRTVFFYISGLVCGLFPLSLFIHYGSLLVKHCQSLYRLSELKIEYSNSCPGLFSKQERLLED